VRVVHDEMMETLKNSTTQRKTCLAAILFTPNLSQVAVVLKLDICSEKLVNRCRGCGIVHIKFCSAFCQISDAEYINFGTGLCLTVESLKTTSAA
jgi:hypothetical protein